MESLKHHLDNLKIDNALLFKDSQFTAEENNRLFTNIQRFLAKRIKNLCAAIRFALVPIENLTLQTFNEKICKKLYKKHTELELDEFEHNFTTFEKTLISFKEIFEKNLAANLLPISPKLEPIKKSVISELMRYESKYLEVFGKN